jgi:hypothetical protein
MHKLLRSSNLAIVALLPWELSLADPPLARDVHPMSHLTPDAARVLTIEVQGGST